MPTLLLSRSCQPEAGHLAEIARNAKWNHQWLGSRRGPTHLEGNDFALYAETDIALRVARQHDLVLIEPSLGILARLPDQYTRRRIRFMPLTTAKAVRTRVFVKPADCTAKRFDAAVYETGWDIFCDENLDPMTPVLASEPVSWAVEYRIIVLERRVVTFSPYVRDGWLCRDEHGHWPYPPEEAAEAISFSERMLADKSVELPPAFTLDVGFINGRGWAVVELNPVWCSGLLGCDLSKLLLVFQRACWRRTDLPTIDHQWMPARVS